MNNEITNIMKECEVSCYRFLSTDKEDLLEERIRKATNNRFVNDYELLEDELNLCKVSPAKPPLFKK